MKKYLGLLGIGILCFGLGITNVYASTTKKSIDSSKCEKVYTNYYFFLDGNVQSWLENNSTHDTIAKYNNNSYLVEFDESNVGYGQVNVSTSTTTSSDGISSMSVTDYYNIFKNAISGNGAYSAGTKNYMILHDWYKVNDSNITDGGASVDLRDYSVAALKNATINATSTIIPQTSIVNSPANPFEIRIQRSYSGSISSATPIKSGNYSYYLHPAVYYIQYCKATTTQEDPQEDEPTVETSYTVTYKGGASNVTNLPEKQTGKNNACVKISSQVPVREGYTFTKWTNGSKEYTANQEYCGEDGDITLTANWTKNETKNETTFTLSYDGNGDNVTNVPSSQSAKTGVCVAVSKTVPVREGYTFTGWTNSGVSYSAGSNYCGEKGDLVLYANWKKNDDTVVDDSEVYYVKYNTNTTDTVTNFPSDEIYSIDSDAIISGLIPLREGYTFVGWSTNKQATVGEDIYNGGSVYTNRKDLLLYAIWKANDGTETKTDTDTDTPLKVNPKTGFVEVLLPLSGVGAASGYGINYLRGKRRFKL